MVPVMTTRRGTTRPFDACVVAPRVGAVRGEVREGAAQIGGADAVVSSGAGDGRVCAAGHARPLQGAPRRNVIGGPGALLARQNDGCLDCRVLAGCGCLAAGVRRRGQRSDHQRDAQTSGQPSARGRPAWRPPARSSRVCLHQRDSPLDLFAQVRRRHRVAELAYQIRPTINRHSQPRVPPTRRAATFAPGAVAPSPLQPVRRSDARSLAATGRRNSARTRPARCSGDRSRKARVNSSENTDACQAAPSTAPSSSTVRSRFISRTANRNAVRNTQPTGSCTRSRCTNRRAKASAVASSATAPRPAVIASTARHTCPLCERYTASTSS